jgi:hypothetical protein
MKNGNTFKLTLAVFIILFLCMGCISGPNPEPKVVIKEVEVPVPVRVAPLVENLVPFTVNILNSLRGARNFSIERCQFYLSGQIILEVDDEDKLQSLDNGAALFSDNLKRDRITIEARTAGQALRIISNGNETELPLCFEADDKYQLKFVAVGGDSSQFQLKYVSQNDPLNNARGTLEYGEKNYKLRFNSVAPYLMIKLDIKNEPEINRRTVPGRKINAGRTAGTRPLVPLTINILNRLKKADDFSMDRIQFFLSGKIVLEMVTDDKQVSLSDDGKVVFEDHRTTRLITFEEKTEGIAVNIIENSATIDLFLCFDTEDRYQLKFSASKAETTPQFLLQYVSQTDMHSDAKGSLKYDNQDYRLRFTGGIPYISLLLSQTEEANTQERTVPGRKIPSP